MAQVALDDISKVYPGGIAAVSGIGLKIGDGELFVLVGPSGSGKSTLLRLIAGLEAPTSGGIWIGGRRVDGLPPRDRDVAMVFQAPALYPHLSVAGNLAFGLRARRFPRREVAARVSSIADRLGLDRVLDRRPATLSGGQRQRVALGRAIVREPRVLLLDEPFSGLDAPLRASMRAELIDLHRKLGTTMIHVTHDQAEALALGDRIAVLDRGRVVQSGTPRAVYDHPATRFVAGFIGSPPMSLLPCSVERAGDALRILVSGLPDEAAWTVPASSAWVGPVRDRGPSRVALGLRPEQVGLASPGDDSSRIGLLTARARVTRLEPSGHETLATAALGPHPLGLRLPIDCRLQVEDCVLLFIDPGRAVWFDAETGKALDG